MDSRLYRVLFGAIALIYASLLTAGWTFAAAVVLPLATAFGETGCIIAARRAYNYLVHSKKVNGQGHLVGDQLLIPGPAIAGAVLSGGYSWVPTSCLSLLLNISARLGWSRFALIQLTKFTFGGPTAMKLFAPTGWSKYHDEMKVYCGYFRFVFSLALCMGRAIMHGVNGIDGPGAPTFNLSVTILIPSILLAEILEDEIVTRGLLPVNPAGPGLLKANVTGDNADPAQLITLEYVPNVPADPWRMAELDQTGRRSRNSSLSRTSISDTDALERKKMQKTVSLGISESYAWARLRKRLGQPRSLNSSPALHGLCEIPFMIHLSFINVVACMTMSLVGMLLSNGYIRGLCLQPFEGPDRILGLLWWEAPFPC